LFSPLEHYLYDEVDYYQFTPPATLRFRLPPGAHEMSYLTGLRPGSYSNGGDSDGYTIAWRVINARGTELGGGSEFINPRDEPGQRGFLERTHELPGGDERLLIIEFGMGPSGISNWDWPLLGRLRLR